MTWRLDFLELTINEHYPESRSSFLANTVLAVKTALLRSRRRSRSCGRSKSDVTAAPFELLPDYAEK